MASLMQKRALSSGFDYAKPQVERMQPRINFFIANECFLLWDSSHDWRLELRINQKDGFSGLQACVFTEFIKTLNFEQIEQLEP